MKNIQKHIFIIGMMCSGKSSLTPILSKKINIPFVDLDKDLISILGIDIPEMFDTLSEKKFRLLESNYFLEHIKNSQYIYATGGGLVLSQKNRLALSKYGTTILLDTPINTIYERLVKDKKRSRPLFKKSPTKNQVTKIWMERKKYYQECANLVIKTENKSLDIIAEEIINYLNQ
ncbi:MAG: hypothetical protein CMG66_02100 [Candidatus Marinimicrobia bacterium]|nr:hypothetical protein [Candidatus Neomarinimicrobiota bacterium]|tara:strand:- start:69138 stop:69662 length:525 start_codon:yes stop_codon:yes gene_type:complete